MAEEKKKYKFDFQIKTDICMDCATCWYVCNFEGGKGAVVVNYNGGAYYAIDKELCSRCGRCARACPVNAVERLSVGEGA